MADFKEGHFTNQRSQKLYYRVWTPSESAKAALVFHHGYGSNCGAYDPEFKRMAEAGIMLFMYDAHGFGRSEPLDKGYRSLVKRWEDLVDDVYTFKQTVVDPQLQAHPLPLFMSGLSMGGMTAILTALRDQHAWQGLILLSPAVDCPRGLMLTIMASVSKLLTAIAPRARLVPQPQIPNVTLNEAERKKLAEDEFFDPEKVRCQTGGMFLSAWDYIAAHETELTLPILIHYSTIDKVVYPPATERFSKRVQSKDVTAKGFDKFAHDIYLDTCKEESCTLLIQWVLQHATASPAAGATDIGSTSEGPAKL